VWRSARRSLLWGARGLAIESCALSDESCFFSAICPSERRAVRTLSTAAGTGKAWFFVTLSQPVVSR